MVIKQYFYPNVFLAQITANPLKLSSRVISISTLALTVLHLPSLPFWSLFYPFLSLSPSFSLVPFSSFLSARSSLFSLLKVESSSPRLETETERRSLKPRQNSRSQRLNLIREEKTIGEGKEEEELQGKEGKCGKYRRKTEAERERREKMSTMNPE